MVSLEYLNRRGDDIEKLCVTASLHYTQLMTERAYHLDITAEMLKSYTLPEWAR